MKPRHNSWNDLDPEEVGAATSRQTVQKQIADSVAAATKELTERVGPQGSVGTVRSGGVIMGGGQGLGAYTGGVRKTNIEPDGDLFVGSNVDEPSGVSLAVFVNAQDYNAEAMDEGDILIGDNSDSVANMKWDVSETQFQFRFGQTVTAYMDADGKLKFLEGEIGGWVIGATSLTDAAGLVGLSSAVAAGDDIRIWAGGTNPSTAPFRVYENGALYASDAIITGTIYASVGSIGGWVVNSTQLYKLGSGVGIVLDSSLPAMKVGDTNGTYIIIDGANQRIRSSNFVAGQTGSNWSTATGDAEFNNIVARGELKTFLLTSSNQMAVAGNIIVSKDAGKLGAGTNIFQTTVDFGKALTPGDWIKIQGPDVAGNASLEWMLIGSLVSGTTYNVTRNVDGSGANTWAKDTPFVVIGHSGDSRIELVAGASGSIQLITQGATWNTQTVQASMSTVAGAITAGGGNVVLDSGGLYTANNQIGNFGFIDTGGNRNKLYIYSDNQDAIGIINKIAGKAIRLSVTLTDASTPYLKIYEDPANSNVAQLDLALGSTGSKISIGSEIVLWAKKAGTETVFNEGGYDIDVRFEGDADTQLLLLDAGLDAIGMGGAAESGKKLKVTGAVKITGVTSLTDTTEATNTPSGALVLSGGMYAAKNIVTDGKIGIGRNPSYYIDAVAPSGADRSMMIFGVSGVTNGMTVYYTHATTRMTLDMQGEIVVGAPTGGGKGAGTINAQAVYDDNTLLTDYVFEPGYELLTIDETENYYREHLHLPTIPGRDEWEKGSFSLGKLATHLWETVEVQALHISELNRRLKELEGKYVH